MKIGFVFDDSLDKPDGIQQYMLTLWRWFTAHGHEVHFLVGQTARSDIPHVYPLSRNIAVTFNGNKLTVPLWGNRRRIKQLLVKERYDVLHIQTPYHPFMAGWVMRLAPPRTVIFGSFHIAPYSRLVVLLAYVQAWLMRPSQRRFDQIVSVSPAAERMARQIYGMRTDYLPITFDYQRFASGQPRPEYNDDTVTILFLGRLVERKGCMTLLQAVARLRKADERSLPAFRVVICGGGPLEASLRAYCRKQQLDDVVQFVGRVSEADKPGYYASSDISVFPASSGESFGIVLIEAMASGRAAVLGGDNPGYASVLGSAPDLLFPAKDAAALAARLSDLLLDRTARQSAADWCAEAAKQYDVELIGRQLIERYGACQKP